MTIPIFDSLTHPTLDGTWLDNRPMQSNTFENLSHEMAQHNVAWAFTVGMGRKIGGYHVEGYIAEAQKNSPHFFPIAYLEPEICISDLDQYIRRLKTLGYVGVKIHPRFSKLSYQDDKIKQAIQSAFKHNLIVFICTYYPSNTMQSTTNHLGALHQLLCESPPVPIILLHGGTTQLLQLTEISCSFPNVIVDLSFTLCHYAGSSLDLDIAYLFKR